MYIAYKSKDFFVKIWYDVHRMVRENLYMNHNKKLSVLGVYLILRKYSDEYHPMRTADIISKLDSDFNVQIERRTLYSDLQLLRDLGIEVSEYSEKNKGYYLQDRMLELAEVLLLCNVVHASHFVPSKHSNDLIEKLLLTQSEYIQERYNHAVYLENLRKKDNQEFFLNFQLLFEAIEEKVCIEFDYMHYNHNKELVKKREKKYQLHPYYLVYMHDKAYLIGKNEKYNEFSHYRIDKMQHIEKLDKKVMELSEKEDPYEYAKNKVYMYGGEELDITLKCHNKILDDIIDTFGKDIPIQKVSDDSFMTKIQSSEQGIIYLAMQYSEYMEIVEPVALRHKMVDVLTSALKKYE